MFYSRRKFPCSVHEKIGWKNSWKDFCNPIFQLVNLIYFRHSISLKVIGGECKSVTDKRTSSWNDATLPTILSIYNLEDIFNADEFGLFYQCLPDKACHLKREKCSGGNKSKERVTDTEYLSVFIPNAGKYRPE